MFLILFTIRGTLSLVFYLYTIDSYPPMNSKFASSLSDLIEKRFKYFILLYHDML
jgi:hypothetical protein